MNAKEKKFTGHLAPSEAARNFQRDPESVVFPLSEFMTQFGLTETELRAELIAGRLIARGTPSAKGFEGVHFTAGAALRWMCHPQTPPHLIERYLDRRARH